MGAVRYCLVVVAGLHSVVAPSTACVQQDLPLCDAYDFYCCECSGAQHRVPVRVRKGNA